MAEPILLGRSQLSHGCATAPRDEERIVAESSPACRAKGDRAWAVSLEGPDEAAADRQGHHAEEAGLPAGAGNAGHPSQELREIGGIVLRGAGETGRSNAGAAVQRPDLQPGILRENRKDGVARCGHRLLDGIRPEGRAALLHRRDAEKTIQRDESDGESSEESAQFPYLVGIASGKKERDQNVRGDL